MGLSKRILIGLKAFFELGPQSSILYLLYQISLRSGYLRLRTPVIHLPRRLDPSALDPKWFSLFPTKRIRDLISMDQITRITAEAEHIRRGEVTLFSRIPYPLRFNPNQEPHHWTKYERESVDYGVDDIKTVWEPARFDWAIKLACAYQVTEDHNFVETFWKYFDEFSKSNPLNQGVNWISGQEIALRVINWTIAAQLMHTSKMSTPDRLYDLAQSIADHATRITKTLIYARAQNNNHLISEAAGLITAGLFLPNHPKASKWLRIGARWFHQAISSQITNDGEYIQHSTNYHRMMLMLSLWVSRLMEISGHPIRPFQKEKLSKASIWLYAMADLKSGHVPNLGHNDGAYILPFTNSGYDDFRPVIQASCSAFCGFPAFPEGNWNDLCFWLGIPVHSQKFNQKKELTNNAVHRIEKNNTWAVLRSVHYESRPAHADQLHVDLWHQGYNIAMDAGTFQYNLNPPWENALATTRVHNTISVNQFDQMSRISRFLWLDWAQARIIEKDSNRIIADHNGYRRLRITHQRKLEFENSHICTITDDLVSTGKKRPSCKIVLQWLLQDWEFTRDDSAIMFQAPFGNYQLQMSSSPNPSAACISIVRGGIPVGHSDDSETTLFGWYSPSYAVKLPALSIRYLLNGHLPVRIISRFIFS